MKMFIGSCLVLFFLCLQTACVTMSLPRKSLMETHATIEAAKLVGAESLAPDELAEAEGYYKVANECLEKEEGIRGKIASVRQSDPLKVKSIKNALRAQVAAEQAITKVQNRVEDAARKMQDENTELKNQVASLQRDTGNLRPSPEMAPKGEEGYTGKSGTVEPKTLYSNALHIFRQGDYEKSRKAFQDFLGRFPNHDLSDNAQYWIGECFYTKGKYKQARKAFNTVLTNFKNGNKSADALLKIGLCDYHLRDYEKSKENWQSVIKRYPRSRSASLARKCLSKYVKHRQIGKRTK